MSDSRSSKQLLRDARDFIGKSRCSMGHSVSEVRDRAKARSCIYCELQFSLYEALGREITELADETFPVHADPTGKTREPPHCPTCDCPAVKASGKPAEPHLPCTGCNSLPCLCDELRAVQKAGGSHEKK